MKIILGPPGTGKTTRLLEIVDEALEQGIEPHRIGFFAFTRKAALEARERAETKFNLSEKDLPFFRTLHSLAFRRLSLTKDQVMTTHDYKDFGRRMGIPIQGYWDITEGSTFGNGRGDRLLFMENLSRIHDITLMDQYKRESDGLRWWEVERVQRGLIKYKEVHEVLDFTDMIHNFKSQHSPELDLLIVDECQDLSFLQWKMVTCLIENSKRVIIAGDDDQAIFRWAGAAVEHFIRMEGHVEVLNKSYRVPAAVQEIANKIIGRVQNRRVKEWLPRSQGGTVTWHVKPEGINMSKGSWLILSRNNYLLEPAEKYCRRSGLPYSKKNKSSIRAAYLEAIHSWQRIQGGANHEPKSIPVHDAKSLATYLTGVEAKDITGTEPITRKMLESIGLKTRDVWHKALDRIPPVERTYLLLAHRQGESLTETPRITLSTIHGAKGGEADNVILLTDMAPRTYQEMHRKFMEDEARVFYVGVTRARSNLHLIHPQSRQAYFI